MPDETLPLWLEAIVATLLLASSVLALLGTWGLLMLKDFFQRLHPTALAYSGAAWCASLAVVIYFSALARGPDLRGWLITILLAITVPVTAGLLARAALFRARRAGRADVPPALQPQRKGAEAAD